MGDLLAPIRLVNVQRNIQRNVGITLEHNPRDRRSICFAFLPEGYSSQIRCDGDH
jgi:hypothetical protein